MKTTARMCGAFPSESTTTGGGKNAPYGSPLSYPAPALGDAICGGTPWAVHPNITGAKQSRSPRSKDFIGQKTKSPRNNSWLGGSANGNGTAQQNWNNSILTAGKTSSRRRRDGDAVRAVVGNCVAAVRSTTGRFSLDKTAAGQDRWDPRPSPQNWLR